MGDNNKVLKFSRLLSHPAAVEQIPGKAQSRLRAVDSAAPREPSPSQYQTSNMKPIPAPALISFFLLGKPRGQALSSQVPPKHPQTQLCPFLQLGETARAHPSRSPPKSSKILLLQKQNLFDTKSKHHVQEHGCTLQGLAKQRREILCLLQGH